MSATEEDIHRAAQEFDADFAARGIATFTPDQIAAFKALMAETDVAERARLCQEQGERLLREAEESQRRYEEVCRQAEELGIDLSGADMDGNAMRARERTAAEFVERAEQEAANEARRLFGIGKTEESAAAVLSRGVGRMRV